MKELIILTLLSIVSCQIGIPDIPWYWKPGYRPHPHYTTTTAPAAVHYRFKRETERNPMPGWYVEVLNRQNKTQIQTQTPPPPPLLINRDECPKDIIHDKFRGRGYFFSWEDNRSVNLRMNWNQAVFFCRARCMELVSIETPKENDFLAKHIVSGRIRSIWTSGRKCDFAGCENQQDMQPADIYGWFWEGSRIRLPPTTDRFDSLWSHTGPSGRPQPDNNEGQNGGEPESCLAVQNNAFADGIAWHDVACSKRKPFICEEPLGLNHDFPKKDLSSNLPATNHLFEYHIINPLK